MALNSKAAGLSDFSAFLLPEQAQDYFKVTERTSVVQQLARKVPMGPTGIAIPHWSGAVQASWVGEGDQKPLTKGAFSRQTLNPTKIAVIFAESAEVVRLNPLGYLETMQQKIGEAFALAFDAAAIHGINKPAKFTGYLAQTSQIAAFAATNAYSSFNNALSILANGTNADGRARVWNGTLLDQVTEPLLNVSLDQVGRPLFVEQPYSGTNGVTGAAAFISQNSVAQRGGSILSRPTLISDHVSHNNIVGIAGDFSQVIWGQIGGLSFDVTDQATLDFSDAQDGSQLISLWQHNMVAVRCEAEFAFLVNDQDAFVKLTNGPLSYTVTVNGAPTGGTFTVKVNGVESGTIAYNASAATVKAALVAVDDGITAGSVTVTGSGPYAVTIPATLAHGTDALTGGTSPTTTVASA
jgi:HK97 family phage major capsid protein